MVEPSPLKVETFRGQIQAELDEDILPFWIKYTPDPLNGGFYGRLSNDLQVDNDTPRSAVLVARILWTYARAYRRDPRPEYLGMARRACEYLTGPLYDAQFGGVYWMVDLHGRPVQDRKHSYAQAFAIYGLSEFYRATQDPESLRLALELFDLLEKNAWDPLHCGYIESRSREWSPMADMRLSAKDPDCRKSMNTMLHIVEAFTNLLSACDSAPVLPAQRPALWQRQKQCLEIFLEHVIDPHTQHFHLFFGDAWNSLDDRISFGHDIEGSWLLVEAAETLGDADLQKQVKDAALAIAQAVYDDGLDADGSVLYEAAPGQPARREKHWWGQVEGMLGFYNAYQLTGQDHFARAAQYLWELVAQKFIDHQYGEWFKVLTLAGRPHPDYPKVGPWECPYHHSRACFEMLERLK